MSPEANMPEEPDCGADVAAYALGALEPAEAAAFRRHLETCDSCQAEVASLGGVIDLMPMSAAQYPAPRGLRRRVMSEIRAEQGRTGTLRRPAFGLPRPALLALCLVALAGAGVVGAELSGGSASPATRVVVASVGHARVRVTGNQAELIVNHLPQPGAGKIYEVWLERGNAAPQPARPLFDVDTRGRADVVLTGSVRGVTAVLVTAEPAGGTRVPTTSPVIKASLS